MGKTLTRYEAVQALIRNPEYLKDYDEIYGGITKGKRFSWPKEKDFLKKYNLAMRLDPKVWKTKSPAEIELAAIFNVASAVSIVPPQGGGPKIAPVKDRRLKKKLVRGFVPKGTPDEDIICGTGDSSGFLTENRFLTLKIDLSAPKNAILKGIREKVDHFFKKVPRSKERNKQDTKIDKFAIWDKYQEIKNFKKVGLFFNENPSTVRKIYLTAFERIMGERYDRLKHNRKSLTPHQLKKTCNICESRNTCTTICPEIAAYVKQDYGSRRGREYLRDKEGCLIIPLPPGVQARSKKAPLYDGADE